MVPVAVKSEDDSLTVSDLKSFVIDDWISRPTEPTVHPWKFVSKISASYAVYYYARAPPCAPDFVGHRMETVGDILLVKLSQEFVVDAIQANVMAVLADIVNLM